MSFKIHKDLYNNNGTNNNLKQLPIKLFTGGTIIALDNYIIGAIEYTYSNTTQNSFFSIYIDNILQKTIYLDYMKDNTIKNISLISLNININKGSLLEIRSDQGIDFVVYLSKFTIKDFKVDKQVIIPVNDQSSILLQLGNIFD